MKNYLLLIDCKWELGRLSEKDAYMVRESLNGDYNAEYLIELVSGEKVDVGVVDRIEEYQINEVEISIDKEEAKIIKDCMDLYLANWEDVDEDKKYILQDGTVFETEDDFYFYFNNTKTWEKDFVIDEGIVLKLEVDNCVEMGHHGYINNSLYTDKGELLVHNICKYEMNDLQIGFGFSAAEYIHNSNEIFDLTELGEKILSKKGYIVKAKFK